MLLPQLQVTQETSIPSSQFSGINLNEFRQDGEWADTLNMTNDYFPYFGTRKKRGIIRTLTKAQGMMSSKLLCYVDNNVLHYGDDSVNLASSDAERQLVMMGAYICVFPDKVVYNTEDKTLKSMENTKSATDVQITMCKLDGTTYNSSNTITSATEPTDKTKYWIDTSNSDVVIKMYSASQSKWVSVATTYVKFSATGLGAGFNPYDAAKFSGVDTGSWIYNGYDFNTTNIIYACGNDYVIVAGFINVSHTNNTRITISREVPQMDFVCEKDNRVWGCSSANHEVYACKQGDPFNWYAYEGLVSDSYALTIGSQGDFTGCATYGGSVFFFKEDGYHKLYGNRPSNYEIQWKLGHGVQKGSHNSISVNGEYMFVKERDGISIYDGSFNNISNNFGTEQFYDAVGCAYRNKYYVAMRNDKFVYSIYVYDIKKRTWIKEDNLRVKYMVYSDDGLYILDYHNHLFVTSDEEIKKTIFPQDESNGTTFQYPNALFYPGKKMGGTTEDTFEWMFETGDIDMNNSNYKYLKRLVIRLFLEASSKMKIEIQYDSCGSWQSIYDLYTMRKRSYEVPVIVERCDHFRLRFRGFGEMKLFGLDRIVEGGSST